MNKGEYVQMGAFKCCTVGSELWVQLEDDIWGDDWWVQENVSFSARVSSEKSDETREGDQRRK